MSLSSSTSGCALSGRDGNGYVFVQLCFCYHTCAERSLVSQALLLQEQSDSDPEATPTRSVGEESFGIRTIGYCSYGVLMVPVTELATS